MIMVQLIVFFSIYISCCISKSAGNVVTAFWVIVTLVEVFMPWLMVLQLIVIVCARSAASKD